MNFKPKFSQSHYILNNHLKNIGKNQLSFLFIFPPSKLPTRTQLIFLKSIYPQNAIHQFHLGKKTERINRRN